MNDGQLSDDTQKLQFKTAIRIKLMTRALLIRSILKLGFSHPPLTLRAVAKGLISKIKRPL